MKLVSSFARIIICKMSNVYNVTISTHFTFGSELCFTRNSERNYYSYFLYCIPTLCFCNIIHRLCILYTIMYVQVNLHLIMRSYSMYIIYNMYILYMHYTYTVRLAFAYI